MLEPVAARSGADGNSMSRIVLFFVLPTLALFAAFLLVKGRTTGRARAPAAEPPAAPPTPEPPRHDDESPQAASAFASNVPGIFVAGEPGGAGLIHEAVAQGREAVTGIARARLRARPAHRGRDG